MADFFSTRELNTEELCRSNNEGLFIDEWWVKERKSKYVAKVDSRLYLRELMEIRIWWVESGERRIQEIWCARRLMQRRKRVSGEKKNRLSRKRYWMHYEWPAEYYDRGKEWVLSNIAVVEKHINAKYAERVEAVDAELTNSVYRFVIRQTWQKLPENSEAKMEIVAEHPILRGGQVAGSAQDEPMPTRSVRLWPINNGRKASRRKGSSDGSSEIPIMSFLSPYEWHYVKKSSRRWKGMPLELMWKSRPEQAEYEEWVNCARARMSSTQEPSLSASPVGEVVSQEKSADGKKRYPGWNKHPWGEVLKPIVGVVRRARI